jgi:RNA polymerase subunit RPABC4/transcription elongation factor Spt4
MIVLGPKENQSCIAEVVTVSTLNVPVCIVSVSKEWVSAVLIVDATKKATKNVKIKSLNLKTIRNFQKLKFC